jgi:rhamnogalacturonyl hydrolase YesR
MSKLDSVKKAMLAMQRYSWEQGVAAQAMLEAGEIQWTILLAREAVHRGVQDGRVAWMGNFPGITDPCSNGEAIVMASKETADPIFKEAYDKLLYWALHCAPRNKEGVIYHQESEPEFWVDSFYMLPPFLANAEHFDEALKQIDGWWNALFDPEINLLSHIWHDDKKTFTRKDFWGVGNGWAMAGMSRVIAFLPMDMENEKKILVNRIKTLLKSSIKYQRNDALFHDVINDPDTFVETNFAQMLAYTIYRGVLDKWLGNSENDTDWLDIANNIRKAAHEKVDSYGYVHGVCGAPDFARSGSAVEGQAFFILMEAAACKLGLPGIE